MNPSSKKPRSPKLKMLGHLCNQTVNLETDAKTLHYSLLKLKHSPSIKHNKDWKKYASSSNRNDMNRIFYPNFCILWDICHDLFCVFGDFITSGTQDTEVTKSLSSMCNHTSKTPTFGQSKPYNLSSPRIFHKLLPPISDFDHSLCWWFNNLLKYCF